MIKKYQFELLLIDEKHFFVEGWSFHGTTRKKRPKGVEQRKMKEKEEEREKKEKKKNFVFFIKCTYFYDHFMYFWLAFLASP